MAEPPPEAPELPPIRTAAERLSPRTQHLLRVAVVGATLVAATTAVLIAAGREPTRRGESYEASRIHVATPSGQATRVAYLRRGKLMLGSFDGGSRQARLLLRIPPGRLACPRSDMLAVSPAGDAVAIVGPSGAAVVNAAGAVTTLGWRPHRAAACQIRWSPNGATVAFGVGHDVLVAGRAGKRVAELHHANGIAFAPSGGALLFAGAPPGRQEGIQSLDLKTGGVRTLLVAPQADDPLPSGPAIAYTVPTGSERAVWMWPGPGKAPRRLTDRHAAVAWLSDGLSLLAVHPVLRHGGFRIVRVAPTGKVTGVARGRMIGVSRVGSVVLVGRPTPRGFRLFALDLATGLRQTLRIPPVSAASWTG